MLVSADRQALLGAAFAAETTVAYEAQRRQALLVALRYACMASVAAVAAFSLFDTYWRQGNVESFLAARALSLAGLLVVLVTSFTAAAARFVDSLAVLACLLASGGAVMVAQLAGSGLSIYRDPIYIVFIGFTLLVPWRPLAAAACFGSSIAFYNGLYFLSGGTGYLGTWLVSNAMLAAGALIASVSVRAIARLRRHAFASTRRAARLQRLLLGRPLPPLPASGLSADARACGASLRAALADLEAGGPGGPPPPALLALARAAAAQLVLCADAEVGRATLWALCPPPPEPVPLGPLLAAQCAAAGPLFAAQRVTLDLQADVAAAPAVTAAAAALEAALEAMLAWALAHAPHGSTVRLSLRPAAAATPLEVRVVDEGAPRPRALLAALHDDAATAPALLRALGDGPHLPWVAARLRLRACGARLGAATTPSGGGAQSLWLPSCPADASVSGMQG